jgi:PAS domain S-box-containing protein
LILPLVKARTPHRKVLLRATLLAGVVVGAIIGGAFLLHRQLRDNERQRAVTEARQLAFGFSRQSSESFWRVREEFIFSLGNLPYERLLLEDAPRPETLVPIRRFLSLNQNLVRAVVVTSPSGISRSATLENASYFKLSPLSPSGLPDSDPAAVTLSGIVQDSRGDTLAVVTAIIDPVHFWRDSVSTFSLSHPSLWINLIDTEGRPVVTRHGGDLIKTPLVFTDQVGDALRTDAREGYENLLFHSVMQDGRTLEFISAYVPMHIENMGALLMISADEKVVLGAAGNALQLLTIGALSILLLVTLSFVLFIRHTLRNQAQLEDGRRRIETVLNTVQSGILLVHAHTGRVTEVNAAAIALLGGSPADILGQSLETLLPAARQSMTQSTPAGTRFEARVNTRSGPDRHVLAATAPLNLAGSLHTLCSFVDITALKETESRLKEAVTQAEQSARVAETANRAKSAFLAMMSHELRTPLNSILGLTESVTERAHGPLTEKQEKYLRLVLDSGRDLLGLINDILDLAKIESDLTPLSLAPCSVRTLCEASLHPIRLFASRRQQTVETVLPDVSVSVSADSRRFQQSVGNLLANASKFTPVGGSIGLEVATTATDVSLSVWDRGIGIAPENLERIFEPFVQLDARLSREYQGTGLGLTLVKRITTLHGGRISVVSTAGQGSRFTLTFPRVS